MDTKIRAALLAKATNEELKQLRDMAHAELEFRVRCAIAPRTKVEFTTKNGGLVKGRVIKVNRKTVKVQADTLDGQEIFGTWRVSTSLLRVSA